MKNISPDIHLQLIKGLKAGSYKDFNRLYELYADLLFGFVLKLTKSPSDAEDILQESFLRIWQTKENISLDKSFKSYLYTISHNLIIDSFRSKMESIEFEYYITSDVYQEPGENEIEESIDFDDFMQKIEDAKTKLTDKQKEIFELTQSGFTLPQVAEQLNVSEKTVKNQLSIVRRLLKSELLFCYLLFIGGL